MPAERVLCAKIGQRGSAAAVVPGKEQARRRRKKSPKSSTFIPCSTDGSCRVEEGRLFLKLIGLQADAAFVEDDGVGPQRRTRGCMSALHAGIHEPEQMHHLVGTETKLQEELRGAAPSLYAEVGVPWCQRRQQAKADHELPGDALSLCC